LAERLYRRDRCGARHHYHPRSASSGSPRRRLEDERVDPAAHRLIDAPEEARTEIGRVQLDSYLGMGFSNLTSLFIITAATLNAHGITDIQTSAQAAEALRPIARMFSFVVFAAGIIDIGLLVVPVLTGSGAYGLGEGLGWTTGLGRLPIDARSTVRSRYPR
jgi:Mn2+/Fe2+ NRAMP family transporter